MSQEAEQSEVETAVTPTAVPLGVRLRKAREARELSAADIARTLKLSTRQIEALEVGNWAGLPGATFIRGFVRNYARLVGVDATPMMAELESQLGIAEQRLDVPTNASGLMPERHKRQRQDYLFVLLGGLVLLLACAAYFLLPEDFWQRVTASMQPAQVAEPATTEQPAFPPPPTSAELAQGALPPVTETQAAPVAPATVPAVAPLPASTVAPAVTTAAPALPAPNTLRLSFVQASWMEVRDRDGNVLLSQHNLAGTEKELSGTPPLSLVVGYVPGVKLMWRGKAVDMSAYARGDVARFNLE
jgi:cytoskeleton protein RodZ